MTKRDVPIATLEFGDAGPGGLPRAVKRELAQGGAVLVAGMPTNDDNAALTHLALSLGVPTTTPVARADKGGEQVVESGFVHRVQALKVPLQSTFGSAVISTSKDAFDCHTDEYFMDRPADIVMMHCVVADAEGGATLLARAKDVVGRLDESAQRALASPLFPHPNGPKRILGGSREDPELQFNPHEIYGFYRYTEQTAPDLVVQALTCLERAMEQAAIEFHLMPQDCLVLDNKRVLHGRRAFDPASRRLLKRVRIRVDA